MSNYVDQLMQEQDITEPTFQSAAAMSVEYFPTGEEPMPFLPEPISLKAITKLPPMVQDAWVAAFWSEIKNLLDKETFAIQLTMMVSIACQYEQFKRLSSDLMVWWTNSKLALPSAGTWIKMP